MKNSISKNLIEIAPSDTLVSMTERGKFSVLAEKFLVSSFSKTKTILRAISGQKITRSFFWASMGAVPLGFLGYFLMPHMYLDALLSNELHARIAVSVIIGCMLSNAVFFDKVGLSAYLFIPATFLFVFWAPYSFFANLFETEEKVNLFFSLGFAFTLPPLLYLPRYAFYRLCRRLDHIAFFRRFFPDQSDFELKKALNKALQHADEVKSGELADLIRDYSPHYTSMLEQLKDEEITVDHALEYEEGSLPENTSETMRLPVMIGNKYYDVSEMPHACVGGASQSGKTNFLMGVAIQHLKQKNVKLCIIDPAVVGFSRFKSHERVTYTSSVDEATEMVLDILDKEVPRRQEYFDGIGVDHIKHYKKNDMPYIVIIFDEFKFFAKKENSVLIKKIEDAATIAAKFGVHIWLGTQRPSSKILPEQLKANLPFTVAFRCKDEGNARVLGAPSHKIGEGQKGLCYLVQGSKQTLVQTHLTDTSGFELTPTLVKEGGELLSYSEYVDNEPGYFTRKLIPAKKSDEGSFFISGQDLMSKLNGRPEAFGFEQTRRLEEGSKVRGYWAKEVT